MAELLAHWEVIVSVGLIIMSFARSDAEHKATKERVTKLERKAETHDAKLNKVSEDVAEIKGLTRAIYDQVKAK